MSIGDTIRPTKATSVYILWLDGVAQSVHLDRGEAASAHDRIVLNSGEIPTTTTHRIRRPVHLSLIHI